ncbi:MAG: hypothetical protein M1819_001135 [Sarea resinae]|nr:MAG: hypothetical protein M1819_001135 [Sarea resinae]
MEKYSQYRDRGSGIAPFFPVPTQPSGLYLPIHIFLFCVRIPILLTVSLTYFFFLQWLPLGSLAKKAILWLMLGVPGIWWIDLQIDGVKKGSLAKHHPKRLPHASSIIASSLTSPIDSLYLAAIFDPIFTASYPSTRLVHRISLFRAILRAFLPPQPHPPASATPHLVPLSTLLQKHPKRIIVVFPETTTTNGRAILPFSPSLVTIPPGTKIFPISLRYTPADITTPVPGTYASFLWNLCSKPTHCIRVRIAESQQNTAARNPTLTTFAKNSYATNFLDTLQADDDVESSTDTLVGSEPDLTMGMGGGGTTPAPPPDGEALTGEEKRVLERVGEALARLGRVKRVGLGVPQKVEFVKAWTKTKKRR